jgi:Spy/CpxP family protein refolding chaperone
MKSVFLIPVLALTTFAQPPHEFFAWWDSPIVKDLNVTDDQQKQIKTIVHDYRNKLIDLRAAVEKADGNLNDILNEDKIDMKRATGAVDKMAAAKAEMNRNVTLMSVSLRAVLTPVQWRELQKRQPHPNGMMPGRPGGMGMPGPGMPGMGPGPMNGQGPNQGPRHNQGPPNRPGNPQPQGQQQQGLQQGQQQQGLQQPAPPKD